MATPAKAKTVKVKADYAFCDVREGMTQTLWGVPFTHIVKEQDGEDFHFLVAELDLAVAEDMRASGRVSKFE